MPSASIGVWLILTLLISAVRRRARALTDLLAGPGLLVLVLAAIPSEGGHHRIDRFGGIGVAASLDAGGAIGQLPSGRGQGSPKK